MPRVNRSGMRALLRPNGAHLVGVGLVGAAAGWWAASRRPPVPVVPPESAQERQEAEQHRKALTEEQLVEVTVETPPTAPARNPEATKAHANNVLALGKPIGSHQMLLLRQGYVACADFRTRSPQWVGQYFNHWTRSRDQDANRDHMSFREDTEIPPLFRSTLSHYYRSNYDRGHMAPAGDFKHNEEAMKESFLLSNISPQVGRGFNRDYWARTEKFVRSLADHFEEVWVFTGPLWLPEKDPQVEHKWTVKYDVIGVQPHVRDAVGPSPSYRAPPGPTAHGHRQSSNVSAFGGVAVPTHFYKTIVVKRLPQQPHEDHNDDNINDDNDIPGSADWAIGAFVIPNRRIHPQQPLTDFIVPLQSLELGSGLRFFPLIRSYVGDPLVHSLEPCSAPEEPLAPPGGPLERALLPQDVSGVDVMSDEVDDDDALDHSDNEAEKGFPTHSYVPAITRSAVEPLVDPLELPDGSRVMRHVPMRVQHLCDAVLCVLPDPNWWRAARERARSEARQKQQGAPEEGALEAILDDAKM